MGKATGLPVLTRSGRLHIILLCPNQDPSRLRQAIVLPFRPVREGIRKISVEDVGPGRPAAA